MIYLKDIDGIPTTAPNDYYDEDGIFPNFNKNTSKMVEKGYLPFDEMDYAQYIAGMKLFINGEFVNNTDPEYLQGLKDQQLEAVTNEYIQNKDELLPIWTQSFINGLATATTMDDVKAKVTAFKNKANTLLADYTTKVEEINNG